MSIFKFLFSLCGGGDGTQGLGALPLSYTPPHKYFYLSIYVRDRGTDLVAFLPMATSPHFLYMLQAQF